MTDAPLEPIRDVFVRAGWREGRNVDVSDVVGRARSNGTRVSPENELWLQQFDGLEIERAGKTLVLSRARMDPVSDDVIAIALEREIGVRVLAIGEQHHATLFVEDSGAVWGCFPSYFGYLGGDIFEAADGMLRQFPLRLFDRQLPEPGPGSPDSLGNPGC